MSSALSVARLSIAAILTVAGVSAAAQQAPNSIQLFTEVNVRPSANGAGYGASAINFNSTTLNLSCPANTPITASLSSTADNTGYVLVDNNINVTVLIAGTPVAPATNICAGGVFGSQTGDPIQNCFSTNYENTATSDVGVDPDTFATAGGVPPIDISAGLIPGTFQLKIDLQDEGSLLANTSLYLNTNCTSAGVTGPALASGNPISSSNPTADQISQDFSFNTNPNQQIGFGYDLSQALSDQTLDIRDQTTPQVGDMPLDPTLYQTQYAANTSFATSSCLIHSGETTAIGTPACKLFTLQCAVGTNNTPTGAQCPVSSVPNEVFEDEFNGPAFALPDIAVPGGPTFHQGIGFLMANEGWTGGPCTFDSAADLPNLGCPQNLLTNFTSSATPAAQVAKSGLAKISANAVSAGASVTPLAVSGTTSNTGSGRTTHPNSTFVMVAQIPEDLTTVTVASQRPGYWINSSTANVTFSSQPPYFTGVVPPPAGAATFVASPIQLIDYGVTLPSAVPVPGPILTNDTVLSNASGCPTQGSNNGPAASPYTPGPQSISGLADGNYLIHYYAQDCAGTQELKYTQASGNWTTSFYTYPLNVDTTAPTATTPTFTSASTTPGTYPLGLPLTANYSCSDALSGVATCGTYSFASGTPSTGILATPLDSTLLGPHTFTVPVTDIAGNASSSTVNYVIGGTYNSLIHAQLLAPPFFFAGSAAALIEVTPGPNSSKHRPTGTVQVLLNGAGTPIQTATLAGFSTGTAITYAYFPNLGIGQYRLNFLYSGDAYNPSGLSAPLTLTIQPAPVRLSLSCGSATVTYGASPVCKTTTQPAGAATNAAVSYTVDSNAPVAVAFSSGAASLVIPAPTKGTHTVTVSYAAQGNYAAATPATFKFTVK